MKRHKPKPRHRYAYEFDCRNCTMTEERRCHTMYCAPIADGENPIHASDNGVLTCEKYNPKEQVKP